MAVEIEMRSRFDEDTYDALLSRLEREGEDQGCDDKHIHFYVLPDKLLKVTDNVAAGSAKVTLKGSKIGQGAAFSETEFPIDRANVPDAVHLFNSLGFAEYRHEAFNKRRNFGFRGVDIAVKWSKAWGHHAEFEVLLDDAASPEAQQEAHERIHATAVELGVRLMTEQELTDFTADFEAMERERKDKERSASPAT